LPILAAILQRDAAQKSNTSFISGIYRAAVAWLEVAFSFAIRKCCRDRMSLTVACEKGVRSGDVFILPAGRKFKPNGLVGSFYACARKASLHGKPARMEA